MLKLIELDRLADIPQGEGSEPAFSRFIVLLVLLLSHLCEGVDAPMPQSPGTTNAPGPEIEAQTRQALSIMPDGLEKRLTSEEFVDLIAYLVSQK